MKNLYQEFFYIPKHGKIREKAIIFRAGLTVLVMLFCLAAMGISAYAYFSCNVSSGMNSVKSAAFDVNITVQIKDETGNFVSVVKNGHLHTVDLDAGIDYYVTLTHSESSTVKTGFIVISAENCEHSYHTQQIGKNADDTTEKISFYINVDYDTSVTMRSHWGTSSYYANRDVDNELYILNGEKISLLINKNPASTNLKETTDSEDTEIISSSTESTNGSISVTTDSGTPSNTTEQSFSPEITDKAETTDFTDLTEATS